MYILMPSKMYLEYFFFFLNYMYFDVNLFQYHLENKWTGTETTAKKYYIIRNKNLKVFNLLFEDLSNTSCWAGATFSSSPVNCLTKFLLFGLSPVSERIISLMC